MVHLKRIGPVVGTGAAVAAALPGCGGNTKNETANPNSTGTSEGVKGGTVTVYHASDFEHLDPARSFVTDSSTAGALIYRSLTAYKWDAKNKKAELVADSA